MLLWFETDLDPVAGTKPIGAQSVAKTLKPNPYVPIVTGKSARQQGNCLCVPSGRCVRPSDNQANQHPVNPTPAPNTDGAGLIDVRIVNKVSQRLVIDPIGPMAPWLIMFIDELFICLLN